MRLSHVPQGGEKTECEEDDDNAVVNGNGGLCLW